jgi:hypothetical protein
VGALTTYTTQVQRLLHDLNFQFWLQPELTDYINEARNRVASDTACLRQVVTGQTVTQGVEQYLVSAIPVATGYTPVDVMQIDLYYGTERITLSYEPWTRFDVLYRTWQSYQQRPVAFTRMGSLYYYVGPTPDQTYNVDIIVSQTPPPLVTDASLEVIPYPFTDLVKYWAAKLAKYKEQSQGEATFFEQTYRKELNMVQVAFMRRVIPSPYTR